MGRPTSEWGSMSVNDSIEGDSELSPNGEGNNSSRPRSLTSLTLQWFAERMRKLDRIKEKVSAGEYDVESSKVAAALVEGEFSGIKKN